MQHVEAPPSASLLAIAVLLLVVAFSGGAPALE